MNLLSGPPSISHVRFQNSLKRRNIKTDSTKTASKVSTLTVELVSAPRRTGLVPTTRSHVLPHECHATKRTATSAVTPEQSGCNRTGCLLTAFLPSSLACSSRPAVQGYSK